MGVFDKHEGHDPKLEEEALAKSEPKDDKPAADKPADKPAATSSKKDDKPAT